MQTYLSCFYRWGAGDHLPVMESNALPVPPRNTSSRITWEGTISPSLVPIPLEKKKESSLNIHPPFNSSINKIILHQAEQGTKQVTGMESPKTKRR